VQNGVIQLLVGQTGIIYRNYGAQFLYDAGTQYHALSDNDAAAIITAIPQT